MGFLKRRVTENSLYQAVRDIADAIGTDGDVLGNNREYYCMALAKNPKGLARKLRKIADSLE